MATRGPQTSSPGRTNLIILLSKQNARYRKKVSAAISNQLDCTRTLKQQLLSTRTTSVHRRSRAITASASFETLGTMLFPSFLNSKKTRDCSPSTWTPSSTAECSTSSQGHADRSTAMKGRLWSNACIATKTCRKRLRAFSTSSIRPETHNSPELNRTCALIKDPTRTCLIPAKKQH